MHPTALFCFVLILSGFDLSAASPKTDPNQIGRRRVAKGLNIYSRQREINLGRRWAQDIEREVRILDDTLVADYVNRIGQNLVRNSDAPGSVVIKVIQSDQINALALPGGFLYVTTGLIRMADNEAQLAGALAHEIAHVTARHGTRRETRNQLSIPLILLGGIPGLAVRLVSLKLSRSAESEADMLGMQYLYQTGYDPGAFIVLLEKLGKLEQSPHRFSNVFSVHPAINTRIEAARKVNRSLVPKPKSKTQTLEFELVSARLGVITLHDTRPPNDLSGKN
jgi:predicted Zn-dependent protease